MLGQYRLALNEAREAVRLDSKYVKVRSGVDWRGGHWFRGGGGRAGKRLGGEGVKVVFSRKQMWLVRCQIQRKSKYFYKYFD